MNNRRIGFLLFFISCSLASLAQLPTNSYTPGDIRQKLEKLTVLGSVLYVAAHPDDENTRVITYYANEKLMRTAYLSATRGDGGQNLVGPEIREGLGLIRTQELLAARRTDGGQQFFSRANDFGYSKHPDETFNIWNKDQVLADFVWIFRKFRPDVVITRFNDAPGTTHGHHTASAILAKEAFALSGDKNAYPEQLVYVEPWQPSKLYWNTSWWFFRNRSDMDTTDLVKINVGAYNPLLGESYTEIAAKSRSMHKSQGFGSSGSRGDEIEYLQQWQGTKTDTPFADIESSWSRVKGSKEVAFYIGKAINAYDERNPSAIIEPLMGARISLEKVKDDFWKEIKRKEIDELVAAAAGLYVSLSADEANYAVGDVVNIQLEAVNRSDWPMSIEALKFKAQNNPISFRAPLPNNRPFNAELTYALVGNKDFSHPYWLTEKGTLGMYRVDEQMQRGKPENDPVILADVKIKLGESSISLEVPVRFRRTDPVDGEVVEPLSIGPPVMVNAAQSVLVFGSDAPKMVEVRVIAGKENLSGKVKIDAPQGWNISPESYEFELTLKGEEKLFAFEVRPPSQAAEGYLTPTATVDGKSYSKGLMVIDYDHIPKQTLFPESTVKVVRVDLERRGDRIGYIAGAGDALPENLEQIGYQVDILEKDDVTPGNLAKYDAVVLGVRAFNTVEWLSFKNEDLFTYVERGGNLIVQYNTNRRLVTEKVAPYDLKVSRDRVAVEEAPVTVLTANHPVMNTPNKITQKDFEGWVQERGLYFPDSWSEDFTAILESNDPGETPKSGGLLVAKYGKGYYVYSGYSWFRELPAGVPGAYRIFVNMISLGK